MDINGIENKTCNEINNSIENIDNTPYKKKVAKLMKLFSELNAYDFNEFSGFSKRKNELKNTKEGKDDMSRELQELVDNYADEKKQGGRYGGEAQNSRDFY